MSRPLISAWFCPTTMLLFLGVGIFLAVEIAVLRRVPAILGRLAPFLTFWSNIVLSLGLARHSLVPIWILPVLNLGMLFVVVVVCETAIPVVRRCAGEGETS